MDLSVVVPEKVRGCRKLLYMMRCRIYIVKLSIPIWYRHNYIPLDYVTRPWSGSLRHMFRSKMKHWFCHALKV